VELTGVPLLMCRQLSVALTSTGATGSLGEQGPEEDSPEEGKIGKYYDAFTSLNKEKYFLTA
jgi:hypothetical protein